MVTIRTPYNGTWVPTYEDISSLPDMAIPDQSMSVKEIIDRYARGIPMDSGKTPMYHGDSDFPHNFNQMELTDRMELLQAHADKIAKVQEKDRLDKDQAFKQAIIDEYERSKPKPDGNPS